MSPCELEAIAGENSQENLKIYIFVWPFSIIFKTRWAVLSEKFRSFIMVTYDKESGVLHFFDFHSSLVIIYKPLVMLCSCFL